MSYGTHNMVSTGTSHAMSVSLANEHLPQMLRQSNYLGADQTKFLGSGDMHTANVNFRVMPHIDSGAPRMTVSRELHELYPTQSTSSKQQLSDHEHDWSKHEIVASVAGLHTKLAELDSEIRTGAVADAQGVSVMRHVQDHAALLGVHAKMVADTQAKHKQTAALTHKICSQMHDTAQLQSTELGACQDDIAQLKLKQSSSVGLVHGICSELQKGLLEHGEDKESMQMALQQHREDISRLKQKDEVAQALLGKMLTMLDQHESVVSNGRPWSDEHLSLLDGMCDAVENTKTRMQSFEKTQQDMQKVVADFKANRLASGAYDTEAVEAKLERYMRVNKDIDGRCTEALQQHAAKVDELQRAYQRDMHEQRMKMQQLERAQQQALDEHQSRMHVLERKLGASCSDQRKFAELEGKVQELALQQLNNSHSGSVSRTTEREVKLLQHEIRDLHLLRKDVDRMHEATNNSVSTMQEDLRRLQTDNKARNEHSLTLHKDLDQVRATVSGIARTQQAGSDDKSIAEMHSKMLDMRRDMTLQNMRIDKQASSLLDVQAKLAA